MESITQTARPVLSPLDDFTWFGRDLEPLQRAILLTLAYADIFDYPLSLPELHRYLIGSQTSPACLWEVLGSQNGYRKTVSQVGDFFTLAWREQTIAVRIRRARIAAQIWPIALEYGRALSELPFVRMVAVTGALAVDNVDEKADIDYLVLTEPGRMWLSRAWCILMVRLARLRGARICPNYFLTTRALPHLERSLYSAHEISQMIPLSGVAYYQDLRALNGWVQDYLPNADGPPKVFKGLARPHKMIQRVFEPPQRSNIVGSLEYWEMKRKIRKFTTFQSSETQFTADQCKGHFEFHGLKTMKALQVRLETVEAQL